MLSLTLSLFVRAGLRLSVPTAPERHGAKAGLYSCWRGTGSHLHQHRMCLTTFLLSIAIVSRTEMRSHVMTDRSPTRGYRRNGFMDTVAYCCVVRAYCSAHAKTEKE